MNPALAAKAARLAPYVLPRRDGTYHVPGGSGTYTVTPNDGKLWCDCPARSASMCSHRQAVIFHLQQQANEKAKSA